jgi:mono/diheme cytochrome c family protein
MIDLRDKLRNSSPRWSLTAFKASAVTLFALAFIIPLALVATPFIEFFNGMAAQPKGKAQMTYGRVYGEQRLVERDPVVGTIPRGYSSPPFEDLGNTIEDAKIVGDKLENPVPLTMENLQRGKALYDVYCIACHGPKGEGDGPVTGPKRIGAPPSLHTDQALQYRDGTIFHVIDRGVGQMPPYGHLLDREERWQVVHYVRALQRSMNPQPGDTQE